MRYQKFPPAPELQPFVECYFIWEGEVSEVLEVQSSPICLGAIVFNYGAQTWARQNSKELQFVPDAFVCGLFTSTFHRILKGKIGMAGIALRSSAVHNIFGIKASTLVNNRMSLDLIPGININPILAGIKGASEDDQRIRILEEFIRPYLTPAKKRLTIIDEAVVFIDHHRGINTVDEVAAHFKISRRYLEKQFLEKVGVSPKFYSRMRRFNSVLYKVIYKNETNWQDVVFENGLHDQSHLAKEFLEFNKMNPTDYKQNHKEMTRFVKR